MAPEEFTRSLCNTSAAMVLVLHFSTLAGPYSSRGVCPSVTASGSLKFKVLVLGPGPSRAQWEINIL